MARRRRALALALYRRKSAFEDGYIAIVERLIARRRELDLTQGELGERYGEDQSFVGRIERCQRRIDVWEFALLCRRLILTQAKP